MAASAVVKVLKSLWKQLNTLVPENDEPLTLLQKINLRENIQQAREELENLDRDGDGDVTIGELVAALVKALGQLNDTPWRNIKEGLGLSIRAIRPDFIFDDDDEENENPESTEDEHGDTFGATPNVASNNDSGGGTGGSSSGDDGCDFWDCCCGCLFDKD
jgi:hypothetical protein